jgi:hypothetical protein
VEVDLGYGQETQLTIPMQILCYLPPIQQMQWHYMTKKTAKQMTWHKIGVRYSDKLVHPFDVEAWTYLIAFIVRKLLGLTLFVLLLRQMGPVLMGWQLCHTFVGQYLLSPSFYLPASSSNDNTYYCYS